MLKGYKTYILSSISIIAALANFYLADATLEDTANIIVTAILAITLRQGIKTDVKK